MAGETLLAVLSEAIRAVDEYLVVQGLGSKVFFYAALEPPKLIVERRRTGRMKSDCRH